MGAQRLAGAEQHLERHLDDTSTSGSGGTGASGTGTVANLASRVAHSSTAQHATSAREPADVTAVTQPPRIAWLLRTWTQPPGLSPRRTDSVDDAGHLGGRHSRGTSTSSQRRLPRGGGSKPWSHADGPVVELVARGVDEAVDPALDLLDQPLQALDLASVTLQRVGGVVVENGRAPQRQSPVAHAFAQRAAGLSEPPDGVGARDQPVGLGADLGGQLAQPARQSPDGGGVAVHVPASRVARSCGQVARATASPKPARCRTCGHGRRRGEDGRIRHAGGTDEPVIRTPGARRRHRGRPGRRTARHERTRRRRQAEAPAGQAGDGDDAQPLPRGRHPAPVTAAVVAQAAPGSTPQSVLVALANATHVTRAIVDQTDFTVRAGLLADEIAATEPDLIGLQEVAWWRHGDLQLSAKRSSASPTPRPPTTTSSSSSSTPSPPAGRSTCPSASPRAPTSRRRASPAAPSTGPWAPTLATSG